jgi:transposase
MATMNGTAKPAMQETGILDSVLGDIMTGGRGAPRPNPEVLARAKRRTYTADYKLKVLGEADAARGSGEIGAVLRKHGLYSSHLTSGVRSASREFWKACRRKSGGRSRSPVR